MKGSPTFRKRQVRAPDHQWIEAESRGYRSPTGWDDTPASRSVSAAVVF